MELSNTLSDIFCSSFNINKTIDILEKNVTLST